MNKYKKEALRFMRMHHIDDLKIEQVQQHALVTLNAIVKETLDEYTNDENHDRVEHHKKVIFELEHIFDEP